MSGEARSAATPLRIAYADPPYPGRAHLYADHPDYAGEVDHAELIERLMATYDGWALSTSSNAIQAEPDERLRTYPQIEGVA